MKPIWAVQTNLGEVPAWKAIRDAVDPSRFIPFTKIPFTEDLPDVPTDKGPVMFYGSVNTINNIYKSGRWNNVYFDPEVFCSTRYVEEYRSFMLNSDYFVMTLEELASGELGSSYAGEGFFCKPNSDLKEFTGEFIETMNMEDYFSNLLYDANGELLLPKETQIVLSKPKKIDAEFRCFIVGAHVISVSMYRCAGQPKKSPGVPPEVIEFAQKMMCLFNPFLTYTMDICYSGNKLYIVELGCFHSSGFYSCDIGKIVKAIDWCLEWGNYSI